MVTRLENVILSGAKKLRIGCMGFAYTTLLTPKGLEYTVNIQM